MRRIPLVIDTREQNPLDFSPFADIRTERLTLWPGDYTLLAASRLIAIERKSVSDLIGTMAAGYAGIDTTSPLRFDCELLGLAGVRYLGGRAFILVEPDSDTEPAEDQIINGHYRAMIPPKMVMAFVDTIRNGWKVPVIFANSRAHAAEIVVNAIRTADAVKQSWRPFDRGLKEGKVQTAPP